MAALTSLDVRQEQGVIKQRYNTAAILLHWLTALIVLAMIGMGLWMVTIPPKTPPRELLFNLHKSLGIVVIMITLVRLGWRWSHPPPPCLRMHLFHRQQYLLCLRLRQCSLACTVHFSP